MAKKAGYDNVQNVEQFEKSVAEVSAAGKFLKDIKRKKKHFNVSLHEQYIAKLKAYCDAKDWSASALIERWIDENCNL